MTSDTIVRKGMGVTVKCERDNTISFIRMLATIMIVVCHFMQFYENELAYWLNVGVQIFLFMSGWLYGRKKINDAIGFIVKNSMKILVDYWIFLTVAVIVYLFFARENLSLTKVALAYIGASTLEGLGHLWYIPYIIACYCLTPILYCILNKIQRKRISEYILMTLLICGIIYVYSYAYSSYFYAPWIICYVVGYFISASIDIHDEINEKKIFLISFPLCIITTALRIYMDYFLQITIFSGVLNKAYNAVKPFCHVVLAITIFIGLRLLLQRVVFSGRLKRLLRISDKISYQVFLCHLFFIMRPLSLLDITDNLLLGIVLVCICTVVSAMLLCVISEHVKELLKKSTVLFGRNR